MIVVQGTCSTLLRAPRFTVLIQLAIIAVTVITAVIQISNSAIHAATVIQSSLGRPW